MGDKNERVAVFPAANIDHFEGLPGFTDSETSFKQFELMLEPCVAFRSRSEVEEDEKWKQLIPYAYIYHPDHNLVLGYQRAKVGGDPRLAGKWSIGFGGHINPSDDRHGRGRLLETATQRELCEELNMYGDYDVPETVGFLYLDDTPVDRVHFGVVQEYVYTDELGNISPRSEIAEIRWISLSNLSEYKFEGWSEAIVWSYLRSDSWLKRRSRGR